MIDSTASETSTAPETSKAQRAYTWLAGKIADGSFPPGYRLVLGPIATELEISVAPVREAIRLLEAEGLVSYAKNVGAQVAMPDPAEYVDVMQTLGALEGIATGLALPLITDDDLDRARELNAALARTLDDFDPPEFTRLNLQFHEVLFHRCPNRHLLELIRRTRTRLAGLRDSTFSFVPGRARRSVAEHEKLITAIEAARADPEKGRAAVEAAVRGHRDATLQAFLDHSNGKAAR
ncbi:GntR family transcriptional regulator [Microlunatus sp. GCM10028923]|uniref:GntR family transcriptional regulator n=1 Tax=Microlunatus sp. GCM10028923 TaxID=3273400 RepID=UPI003614F946